MERRRTYTLPVARTTRVTRWVARLNYERAWQTVAGAVIALVIAVVVKDIIVALVMRYGF